MYKVLRNPNYKKNDTGSFKIVQIFSDKHSEYYYKFKDSLSFKNVINKTVIQSIYIQVIYKWFNPNSLCAFFIESICMPVNHWKIIIIHRFKNVMV